VSYRKSQERTGRVLRPDVESSIEEIFPVPYISGKRQLRHTMMGESLTRDAFEFVVCASFPACIDGDLRCMGVIMIPRLACRPVHVVVALFDVYLGECQHRWQARIHNSIAQYANSLIALEIQAL
jgi:hypothetical protein